MARGILGRKVGMTQIYDDGGNVVPVTVIEAGPCHVLQLRTSERDGYEAVQLGFLDKPRRLASRSERGHVAKLSSKRSRIRSSAGVETCSFDKITFIFEKFLEFSGRNGIEHNKLFRFGVFVQIFLELLPAQQFHEHQIVFRLD